MGFSSKLIEDAVAAVSKLPGIGKKSALRIVLHLIKENPESTHKLVDSLTTLRQNITFCAQCHAIADSSQCHLCGSPRRDKSVICVVEDTRDVIAIENTAQFSGLYHVLGGVISPIHGVGPSDLKMESLMARIEHPESEISELILALSPTMEGDTTAFYIHKRVSDKVKVSVIARGIPIGGDLEYADEITLGRSITGRTLFQ